MSGKRPWLLTASLANVTFLYAPIAVLIVFSFNASRLSASWHGFTFHWYNVLAGDEALWMSVKNSLLVAAVSTAVATCMGIGAAVALERLSVKSRRMAEAALILPLVIPEVMMGVALMLFFVMVRWTLGLGTVTVGHIAFNLPIVVMIVRARLRKLDPGLEEAARDLGATPWQSFQRVTLPLIWPAVAGAALMAFTISLDDFIVTFFTAGPGSTTLPLRVYSMIRAGVSPEINALSSLLVLVSMGLVGVGLLLNRK